MSARMLRLSDVQLELYRQRRSGVGNAELVGAKRIGARLPEPLERELITPDLVLPWPPATGNRSTRHTRNGGHYTLPAIKDYRNTVAALCASQRPVSGPYVLHLTLSPPNKCRRDADNCIKVVADALVRCGYLSDDSLAYMRELHVTSDGYRGEVGVRALARERSPP